MNSKIYFPNLNGIRFIAALAVIIHHIEQIKSFFIYDNLWQNPYIRLIGKLGVILFFVLSGFLITYLLLMEKKQGTISIKDFYIRRILRIWPLYYLIVICGLFIFPHINFIAIADNHRTENIQDHFIVKIILFFLFLPNLAFSGFSPVPYIAQTWSVGVEEQFYLIWPVLLKKMKNTFAALVGVIFFYLLIKFILIAINNHSGFFDSNKILHGLFGCWDEFNIDCMAIGGIAAYTLFHKKERLLNFFFNPYIQICTYLALVLSIALKFYIKNLQFEYYSLLFAIIIVNLAANPKTILKLENRLFSYLGKISFGLYMYHYVIITFSIKLLNIFFIRNNVMIYTLSIALTIFVASVSYEFFEKKFLKLKKRFTIIESGNEDLNVVSEDKK
jgi:peptidoglycan/LPS O-acetylase OafA/YrhL